MTTTNKLNNILYKKKFNHQANENDARRIRRGEWEWEEAAVQLNIDGEDTNVVVEG